MNQNKKTKILQTIRQGQIGGGESHLLNVVANIDRSRFEPVVLSFTDGPMIDELKKRNVRTHIIPSTRPFDVSTWRRVKTLMKQEQVNLVHAHGTRAASNTIIPARSLGLPFVYTVHGWSFHQDQSWPIQKIRITGERLITRRADINISVSESNQQSGQRVIKGFRSLVIHNGIDREKFSPLKKFPDLRQEFQIPASRVLFVFIARFTAHKQPLALIESFARALQDNKNIHLLMVGEGDQVEEGRALIDRLKISDHVCMERFRQDIPAILASADVYVLPSLWEGLPMGLLEAMTMGKAVIASNVDGTKDVLVHGQNGYMIEVSDLVSNLSSAIGKLALDTELRQTCGRAALETVRTKFDAIDMTRKIEALYDALLQGKSVLKRPG